MNRSVSLFYCTLYYFSRQLKILLCNLIMVLALPILVHSSFPHCMDVSSVNYFLPLPALILLPFSPLPLQAGHIWYDSLVYSLF
jgi:hypothetical protein